MFERGMVARVAEGGFIAAPDRSGGSTPGALRLYGIPETAYRGEAEMLALMHAMRVRIMTAPAFEGTKVMCAILFEVTMNGTARDAPVPSTFGGSAAWCRSSRSIRVSPPRRTGSGR